MTETNEPIVRIRSLRKSFGDLSVLRDVDMDVARGEKVAIIGPSGSGKSTILRILMTLTHPDSGRVEIDGESVYTMTRNGSEVPANDAHLRAARARVGIVFQHFNLFPHMTALKNIALAPTVVQGVPPERARARARELLEMVGIGDKADVYPAKLSGGEKQRVAIARALAPGPEIMLFDEITSALDPERVGEVLGVLEDLAADRDMTMLVVTHQMSFARQIADRVVFFDEGRIFEEGPPEKILSDPTEARTKEFLRAIL